MGMAWRTGMGNAKQSYLTLTSELLYCRQVCAQLLWESGAKVLVDFTPGAGMMCRAALLMKIKIICVCLNAAHQKVFKNLMLEWLTKQIVAGNAIAPVEKEKLLAEAKPARLTQWEVQKKKRGLQTADDANAKRAKMAASLENLLATMSGDAATTALTHTPVKAEPKATAPSPSSVTTPLATKPEPTQAVTLPSPIGTNAGTPVAELPAPTASAAGNAELSTLLQDWS